jgi:PEP-CTERM putative exosortase interaction domain
MQPRSALRLSAGALAISFVLALVSSANAAILTLSHSGTFSATSQFNGVPFGMPTPFTYQAVFDSTTDTHVVDGVFLANGLGIFDTVVTFNITGYGTFTSDPAGDVNVLLGDPSGSLSSPSFYAAGLADSTVTFGFFTRFNVAAPPFDADVPTPSVLSNVSNHAANFIFIPLNGENSLFINGVDPVGATAQITGANAAVPEPSTFALFGMALGAGCYFYRRQRTLAPVA